MIKKLLGSLLLVVGILLAGACEKRYAYESIPSDPMSTRIYTLENGLKVYMSVNKDEPRIQANIAVKVGAKNDPSETTGLAHYFEHLMFKGTEQFGTQNYELEKPLLDKIEQEFERYRTLTDETERAAAYHIIDSLSYEASKHAIPNEYDKLMSTLGATGTNAYTSYDMTVYVENIPANQAEAWAKVQADRFKNNVIRGFHTELETVYEEKNMSLTRDVEKVVDTLFHVLFPHHPYGQQSVLGTQEHLKNPSIINIKNYYKKWYVPNNMAICLSGDFDPDRMIRLIDTYFGDMVPNPDLKQLEVKPEEPLKAPVEKTVYGKEAPSVLLAWSLPGVRWEKTPLLYIVSDLLYNGNAGLFDIHINQAQRTLTSSAFPYAQADYTAFILMGEPKAKQTLGEVRAIMLEQMERLKKGEFEESALAASVNNYKKRQIKMLESNDERATLMGNSFINGTQWSDEVALLGQMSGYNKKDVMAFAKEFFGNHYVQVNKEEGIDPNELKIDKPKITPILTNRDTSSQFLKQIQQMTAQAQPIEPVFLNYETDLQKLATKDSLELLYKQNASNDLFELTFMVDLGSEKNKWLSTSADYFVYLGTSEKDAAQIQRELYALACDVSLQVAGKRSYLMLSGLSENMNAALQIIEDKLADVQPNEAALANLKSDVAVARVNAKLNQQQCFRALARYVHYGPEVVNQLLSDAEVKNITSAQLIGEVKGLFAQEHRILYYGPLAQEKVLEALNTHHRVTLPLAKIDKTQPVVKRLTRENQVYLAPYDAKQIYMLSYSNDGAKFDPQEKGIITLYNNYFGGGMNSIVFQEMREARGLAYSASAYYEEPANLSSGYAVNTFIATQNDKMMDAITAFDAIINEMPLSQGAFQIAKENVLANIRTNRILKSDVLWDYLNAREMGIDRDIRREVFENVQKYTLEDVKNFQQEVIKGRVYSIGILGDAKDLDLKTLGAGRYGKITPLTQEDIFGY